MIVGIIFVVIMFFVWKNKIKNLQKDFDKKYKNGCLYLSSRNMNVARKIKIKPHKFAMYMYKPTEVTYTSVRAGGVTTGGFDVDPEHYAGSSLVESGRYMLCYYGGDTDSKIKTIKFNPSWHLSQELQQFLVEPGKLVLEHNIETMSMNEANKVNSALNSASKDNAITLNIAQDRLNKKELTKEECEAVLSWISGR